VAKRTLISGSVSVTIGEFTIIQLTV
jgi:hypothetical protein